MKTIKNYTNKNNLNCLFFFQNSFSTIKKKNKDILPKKISIKETQSQCFIWCYLNE